MTHFYITLLLLFSFNLMACSSNEEKAQKTETTLKEENNNLRTGDEEGFKARPMEIPFLRHTNLDADFKRLKDSGLYIKPYSNTFAETVKDEDFKPEYKVAWNEEYLLIRYTVKDDVHYKNKSWRLWQGDALALFFGKEIPDSRNFIQETYVADQSRENNMRTLRYDFRKQNTYKSEYDFISSATFGDSSITMEIAVPFNNFDTKGKVGDKYKLQLIAYDYDQKRDKDYIAYPLSYIVGISYNPWAARKIKLVKNVKPQKELTVRAFQLDYDSLRVILYGDSAYAGKRICLRDKKLIYFEEEITSTDSTLFTFTMPLPNIDSSYKTTALFIDDEFVETVNLGIIPIKRINTESKRFENTIRVFEALDRINGVPDSCIVFLGSSTIRRWESLQKDFKNVNILNRAFGGSIASDVNLYIDRIITPYKPKKIIYYEGDNDVAFRIPPATIADTTKVFIERVKKALPKTEIILLSIKPSPSRKRYWSNMQKTNAIFKAIADTAENVEYVDITKVMFDERGQILKDIWENDKLHLNEKGYELWKPILKKHLK